MTDARTNDLVTLVRTLRRYQVGDASVLSETSISVMASQAADAIERLTRHPSVGTGSMNAPEHGRMNSLDWMCGWNACLDALEKAEDERNRTALDVTK